jgi:hypothetical protein
MLHFVAEINSVSQATTTPEERKQIAHQRRMARQSLRRLILRYPHLANEVVFDSQNGAVAA